MPLQLTILCWDHPRCLDPIKAAGGAWQQLHPEITFTIKARPLSSFNDQPIAEIARTADLLFIDHPMVGGVAQGGALVALNSLLDDDDLKGLAADSIGASHDSYNWRGSQWATAVDAACQVAVVVDSHYDEWGQHSLRWDDVLAAAKRLPGSVALPLYPSDALLSLLSISADLRAAGAVREELWPRDAVELMVALAGLVDRRSFELNPPRLLDLMSLSRGDDLPVYAPLLFGYTNYQRPSRPGRRLRFFTPPSVGSGPAAVLGGAGLAVSAYGRHPEDAAAFAAWMAHSNVQREVVLPSGGQPASRSVWLDDEADQIVGGFFSGTRTTMESSYLRPRTPWWPSYQEVAGVRLAHALRIGEPASIIHRDLTRLLQDARHEELAR